MRQEASLKLSFRAQSLDNLNLDPMEVDGRRLEEKDQQERQRLVQDISRVSTSGRNVFSEGLISAFRWRDEFILEIPSDRPDSSGRIAPIICYGHVSEELEKSWPEDVVGAIRAFASRIGRGVSDHAAVRRGIEAVLKKNWRSRLWGIIKELLAVRWKKILLALWASLIPYSPKKR